MGVNYQMLPHRSLISGEVLKYVTSAWEIGSVYTFYVLMNKKKWDALPSDVQKVMADYNKDFLEKWPGEWNKIDREGLEFFKKNGGQIVTISQAENARWVKAVEPIVQTHEKELVSKGYKTEEVDSWVKFMRERIEYWHGQQKALKDTVSIAGVILALRSPRVWTAGWINKPKKGARK